MTPDKKPLAPAPSVWAKTLSKVNNASKSRGYVDKLVRFLIMGALFNMTETGCDYELNAVHVGHKEVYHHQVDSSLP